MESSSIKIKEKIIKQTKKDQKKSLVDDYGMIKIEEFTNKPSDYLKKDILYFLKQTNSKGDYKKLLKKELFTELSRIIKIIQKYKNDTTKIRIIQNNFREKHKCEFKELRGIGLFQKSKCKNECDFLTFESIFEIDNKWFFSYEGKRNNIWFFDIRSFIKLIENNQGNPYTRENIPEKIKKKGITLYGKIIEKYGDDSVNQNVIEVSRKEQIKLRTINLFSTIEQHGYECHFNWLLELRIPKLRQLYRELEDLWNYRLQLTHQMKSLISPPNGIVFSIPLHQISTFDIYELLETILNELSKLHSSQDESNRKLGSLYFLIGFGNVSFPCNQAHPWLNYV